MRCKGVVFVSFETALEDDPIHFVKLPPGAKSSYDLDTKRGSEEASKLQCKNTRNDKEWRKMNGTTKKRCHESKASFNLYYCEASWTISCQVSDYKDEIDRLNRELQEVKKKFYDQKKREMIQQDHFGARQILLWHQGRVPKWEPPITNCVEDGILSAQLREPHLDPIESNWNMIVWFNCSLHTGFCSHNKNHRKKIKLKTSLAKNTNKLNKHPLHEASPGSPAGWLAGHSSATRAAGGEALLSPKNSCFGWR